MLKIYIFESSCAAYALNAFGIDTLATDNQRLVIGLPDWQCHAFAILLFKYLYFPGTE